MITYKEYTRFVEKYQKQTEEIKKRLQQIQTGVPFGHPDLYSDSNYYPCKYLKTVDAIDGVVKIIEPSINRITEEYVMDLFIDAME